MANINNIDDLIGKFLTGEASPEEAMFLEDWKNESAENLNYFNNCKKIFDGPAKISNAGIDKKLAWNKIKDAIEPENKVKPWVSIYWRIAASITLIIGIGAFILFQGKDNTPQLISYNTVDAEKNISLADSTFITVLPHSELSYNNDFGKTNRKVFLKGSAYFSVTHKDSLPFIIDAGGLFIQDIGTKFNVTQSTDTIIVKVDEGVVLLFDTKGSEITVTADEKAIYIKSEKRIQKILEKNPNAVLKFDFEGKTLKEILTELGKAYHLRIELESELVGDCQVTTQFNNEDIDTILTVITETLGLKYVKTSEGYQIKGNKCGG